MSLDAKKEEEAEVKKEEDARFCPMYSQISSKCWICEKEEGTLFHIFWTCLKVVDIWKMVLESRRKV